MRDDVAALDVAADSSFEAYRDDPPGFVRDVLGAESATRRSTGEPYQFSVLEDLATDPRVAVRSGHGVGKSTLDAWAAIWWVLTRPFSRVVIVAPEFTRQIRAVLFSEIRKWVRRSKVPLPLSVLANRVLFEGCGDEWGVIGLPATEPDRIEGFHAEGGVLLILDETKGIPKDVYDALQGALTGKADNRLLVTSTPGPPSGIFYDVFSKGRDDWKLHHVPSTDSSMVSESWVEQRKREWGEASPLFVARVLGDFAEEAEGTLFKLRDLEAAVERILERPTGDDHPGLAFGVDLARFGDDASALAVWLGPELLEIHLQRGLDTMQAASWIASEMNRRKPSVVRLDEIGLGAGVVDRLHQLGHENVEGVNVGSRPMRPDLFLNVRAEIFWLLKEALERGEVSLPDDEGLIAELSAIRYQYSANGRIQLEPKAETKKRIGRSPDLADAAVLGFVAELFWVEPIEVVYDGELYGGFVL